MRYRTVILSLITLAALGTAQAEDTVKLETSTVTGNRELTRSFR